MCSIKNDKYEKEFNDYLLMLGFSMPRFLFVKKSKCCIEEIVRKTSSLFISIQELKEKQQLRKYFCVQKNQLFFVFYILMGYFPPV